VLREWSTYSAVNYLDHKSFGFGIREVLAVRVHPTVVHTSNTRWHFPVAIVLLVLVLLSNLYKGARSTANAVPEVKLTTVVVARAALESGKLINKESLALENRPVTNVPSDAIRSFDEVVGKVATGPILPGYALVKPQIAEPKGSAAEEKAKANSVADEALQQKLALVAKDTIGLNIVFQNSVPPKGSRIAVSLQGKSGVSSVVAAEAWVENVVDKQTATIKVRPPVALFLQDAKALGTFSFFIVPEEGPSPFAGDTVSDIAKLREKLLGEQGKARASQTTARSESAPTEKKKGGDFSGYAWVSGQGVKYSIDGKGKLYVIDGTGAVNPLYDYGDSRARAPSEAEPAQDLPEKAMTTLEHYREVQEATHKRAPGEVRTGLETIFPEAKIEQLAPSSNEQ